MQSQYSNCPPYWALTPQAGRALLPLITQGQVLDRPGPPRAQSLPTEMIRSG